ncbi:MAG: ParB/RepB/Spo0J family partition protein [Pseudomonadota bacterium]
MKLDHIDLNDLKLTKLNVRKRGAKDVADILPSIRSLGILQPLLVRPNCEGFEIVAGQRRFHAASQLAEEAKDAGESIDPVPCIIMQDGDDAKAIEASLAENIARLPMDEIDQYKAFAALKAKGQSVTDIAGHFGVTERLVKQRLAIANLYQPILTAYRKDEIGADTVRSLTLATKRQQKAWWALFTNDDEYAPQGRSLKAWLFGGSDIPVSNALFDIEVYGGNIISDLFGEERYFDDAAQFWTLQNQAIAEAKERYLANGWGDVIIGDAGEYWQSWNYVKAAKKDGGRVYVSVASDGEVTFREGYITDTEARKASRNENAADGGTETVSQKPELTKAMQNYLSLHRHAIVRERLLAHPDLAQRLALAQMIAGSDLWQVHADPQKADKDSITASLATNKAQSRFADERAEIAKLLDIAIDDGQSIVPNPREFGRSHCAYALFAKLCTLDDAVVTRLFTFVIAETIPSTSAFVEGLGTTLAVDVKDDWSPDDTFFDLFRDKEAINACVKEAAGKASADAHVSSTARVQQDVIRGCLDGTRETGNADWQPRYMSFPMKAYTKRGGIDAIERFGAVKQHFA